MNERIFSVLLLASVTLLLEIQLTSSCNQMLCASAVSKCMLTQQCKCDIKTCSCCDDCVNCLSWLWKECCSCVDLCPKPNETRINPLSKQSHSETLEDHIPGLFSALIEDSDEEKWSVFTFPVDFDVQTMSHSQKNFLHLKTITVNCSVAYMSGCMSMRKCKETCNSMGANAYRWFLDGCCECVGSTCPHHGIEESRCSECPESKIGDGNNNHLDMPPNEDEDLEYGEDMKAI
ncbi:hypothetical protein ACKWTF_006942 [Chironomus riparius]